MRSCLTITSCISEGNTNVTPTSQLSHCLQSKFAYTANKGVVTINYGSDLRKMRKRAGMSQEDIALELHMSISNVSRLETGKYELKAIDLARWAEVTNAMDMLVAMFIGVDLTIVQQVLETISGTITTIFLGGIL